jgi:hypothetical protein
LGRYLSVDQIYCGIELPQKTVKNAGDYNVGGTPKNAELMVENLAFLIPLALIVTSTGERSKFKFILAHVSAEFQPASHNQSCRSKFLDDIDKVPVIVNLQNTVTNPISNLIRWYRLKQ